MKHIVFLVLVVALGHFTAAKRPNGDWASMFDCDEDGYVCRKKQKTGEQKQPLTGQWRNLYPNWRVFLSAWVTEVHTLLSDAATPNPTTLALIGVTALTALLVMYKWMSLWRQLGVPGPTAYTFFGNCNTLTLNLAGLRRTLRDWASQYGKVYGIYLGLQPVLVVTDVASVAEILSNRTGCFSDRPTPPDELLEGPLRYTLFNTKGRDWETLRHILSYIYDPANLKYMMVRLNRCATNLADYVEDQAVSDQIVEVQELMTSYVYDTTAAIVLGLDLDHRDNDSHDFFEAMTEVLNNITVEHGGFYASSRLAVLVRYFHAAIQERRCPHDVWGRLDFLGMLLHSGHPQLADFVDISSLGLADNNVQGAMMTWVMHGNQTLLSALQFIVHLLATHPRHQQLCYDEIDRVVGTDDPDEGALDEMEYLDLVIREALRMLSPVQEIWRCTKRTTVVRGITIPQGAAVLIPVSLIHDDETNFPQPFLFKPERYQTSGARDQTPPILNLSFGGGARVCLGLWITILQLKVALVHVLRRVRFGPVSPDPLPLDIDITKIRAGLTVTDDAVLRPANSLRLTATPRNPMAVLTPQLMQARLDAPGGVRHPASGLDVGDKDSDMLVDSGMEVEESAPGVFQSLNFLSLWGPPLDSNSSSAHVLSPLDEEQEGEWKERGREGRGVTLEDRGSLLGATRVKSLPATTSPLTPLGGAPSHKSSDLTSSRRQRGMAAGRSGSAGLSLGKALSGVPSSDSSSPGLSSESRSRHRVPVAEDETVVPRVFSQQRQRLHAQGSEDRRTYVTPQKTVGADYSVTPLTTDKVDHDEAAPGTGHLEDKLADGAAKATSPTTDYDNFQSFRDSDRAPVLPSPASPPGTDGSGSTRPPTERDDNLLDKLVDVLGPSCPFKDAELEFSVGRPKALVTSQKTPPVPSSTGPRMQRGMRAAGSGVTGRRAQGTAPAGEQQSGQARADVTPSRTVSTDDDRFYSFRDSEPGYAATRQAPSLSRDKFHSFRDRQTLQSPTTSPPRTGGGSAYSSPSLDLRALLDKMVDVLGPSCPAHGAELDFTVGRRYMESQFSSGSSLFPETHEYNGKRQQDASTSPISLDTAEEDIAERRQKKWDSYAAHQCTDSMDAWGSAAPRGIQEQAQHSGRSSPKGFQNKPTKSQAVSHLPEATVCPGEGEESPLFTINRAQSPVDEAAQPHNASLSRGHHSYIKASDIPGQSESFSFSDELLRLLEELMPLLLAELSDAKASLIPGRSKSVSFSRKLTVLLHELSPLLNKELSKVDDTRERLKPVSEELSDAAANDDSGRSTCVSFSRKLTAALEKIAPLLNKELSDTNSTPGRRKNVSTEVSDARTSNSPDRFQNVAFSRDLTEALEQLAPLLYVEFPTASTSDFLYRPKIVSRESSDVKTNDTLHTLHKEVSGDMVDVRTSDPPERRKNVSKEMSQAGSSRPSEGSEFPQKLSKSRTSHTPEMPTNVSREIAEARANHTPEIPTNVSSVITQARANHTPEIPTNVSSVMTQSGANHTSESFKVSEDMSEVGKPHTLESPKIATRSNALESPENVSREIPDITTSLTPEWCDTASFLQGANDDNTSLVHEESADTCRAPDQSKVLPNQPQSEQEDERITPQTPNQPGNLTGTETSDSIDQDKNVSNSPALTDMDRYVMTCLPEEEQDINTRDHIQGCELATQAQKNQRLTHAPCEWPTQRPVSQLPIETLEGQPRTQTPEDQRPTQEPEDQHPIQILQVQQPTEAPECQQPRRKPNQQSTQTEEGQRPMQTQGQESKHAPGQKLTQVLEGNWPTQAAECKQPRETIQGRQSTLKGQQSTAAPEDQRPTQVRESQKATDTVLCVSPKDVQIVQPSAGSLSSANPVGHERETAFSVTGDPEPWSSSASASGQQPNSEFDLPAQASNSDDIFSLAASLATSPPLRKSKSDTSIRISGFLLPRLKKSLSLHDLVSKAVTFFSKSGSDTRPFSSYSDTDLLSLLGDLEEEDEEEDTESLHLVLYRQFLQSLRLWRMNEVLPERSPLSRPRIRVPSISLTRPREEGRKEDTVLLLEPPEDNDDDNVLLCSESFEEGKLFQERKRAKVKPKTSSRAGKKQKTSERKKYGKKMQFSFLLRGAPKCSSDSVSSRSPMASSCSRLVKELNRRHSPSCSKGSAKHRVIGRFTVTDTPSADEALSDQDQMFTTQSRISFDKNKTSASQRKVSSGQDEASTSHGKMSFGQDEASTSQGKVSSKKEKRSPPE